MPIGKHMPGRAVHGAEAPMDACNQLAGVETLRFNEPSPALYASTNCTGPATPTATGTGPTADVVSRSLGAA